jgi:hypothetical protein
VQLLSRIGNVLPSTVFAAPLILRDKVTAVIYADSGDGPDRIKDTEALDILTVYAAKLLDALSAQKGVPRTGEHMTPPPPAPAPPTPPPRPREAVVPHAPAVVAADDDDEGSGTVMFSATDLSSYGQAAPKKAPPPRVAPAPAANLDALDPETRKKHEEAQRFARLLVSEIKLYNEAKVKQGQKSRDLYDLLRDDIERSRQLYRERVAESIRGNTNYFNDELVRILAEGDEGAMGQPLPAT